MISFTEAQIIAWASPVWWPFLRVLAVFTSAPVLSSKAFPVRSRIALALLVALAAQSGLQNQVVPSMTGPEALAAVVQQVGIGVAIGFSMRVVFAAIELAGEVIGFQMGLNFAAFFDPSTNAQSSAVARFFGQIAALLFVVLNGHLLVLQAVVDSFQIFPVDQNFLRSLQTMRLHQIGAELFASGLWISLPVVGMLMFVNLGLGIVSRVAPQMNIYAVGFPVTLTVGLIGITATLPMLDQPFLSLMERLMGHFAAR